MSSLYTLTRLEAEMNISVSQRGTLNLPLAPNGSTMKPATLTFFTYVIIFLHDLFRYSFKYRHSLGS